MGYFGSSEHVQDYAIQNVAVRLRHHPNVFPPSPFGLRFAEVLDLRAGERVADIGTGTGLLGILAAKKGAREVIATDTSAAAVELAGFNARHLNAVEQMAVVQGSFFGEVSGCFDAIVANLPQEMVPPAYLDDLNADQAQALCGGSRGGNELLLEFLELAPRHMHAGSRLYIIVNTITDYKATLAAIGRNYRSTLVWEGVAPTKDFVAAHLGWFRERLDTGMIDIFTNPDGRWHARQFVYELSRLS